MRVCSPPRSWKASESHSSQDNNETKEKVGWGAGLCAERFGAANREIRAWKNNGRGEKASEEAVSAPQKLNGIKRERFPEVHYTG